MPHITFISSLRRHGLRQAFVRKLGKMLVRARVAWLLKIILDYGFDKRHGTMTSGGISLDELRIDSRRKDSGTFYMPLPRYEFEKAISRLNIDTAKYTFVDFGCGMGRVLLYAMEHNFGHVIGVEFSNYLADIAKDNIARYSKTYRVTSEIVLGDAAEFVIPKGPCVLMFFNPFSSTVTGEVLSNIYDAYLSGNRDLYIVWHGNPSNAAPLFEAPWLEVVAGETECIASEDSKSLLRRAHFSMPYSIFKVCRTDDDI